MLNNGGERASASDIARGRAALRDIWPGLAVLVVLQGSLLVAGDTDDVRGWPLVWALSPLAPALWLVWAQLRALRRADELQRVTQLEALAIGFATTIVLALLGGLLDAAGVGSTSQTLQVTFIGGVLAWVLALGLLNRPQR